VIGRTDRDELHEALIRARDRLGREVNPVVVSPSQWSSSTDPFLAELAGEVSVTTAEGGARVERARVTAGLSQRALADITGISQAASPQNHG
jgi:hypothetical protein